MLVHCCDRCCVYKKEIQPCRTKYRGIWAILMHKMMFPSESCNSVSNCTFCEFVRFLLSRKCSPRVPPEPLRVALGVRVPQFGNRCRRGITARRNVSMGKDGTDTHTGRSKTVPPQQTKYKPLYF